MLAMVLAVRVGAAAAQQVEPIEPDRPGVADWPNIIPPGDLQLEFGSRFERENDGDEAFGEFTVPKPLLRLGLNEWVEARVETEGLVYRIPSGESGRGSRGDLRLGTKLVLFDESGWRPLTGLLMNLSLPTGSPEVSSDGYDPEASLLFGWDLEGGPHTTLNLGFSSTTQGKDDRSRVFGFEPSLSLNFPLGERATFFVEYYAEVRNKSNRDIHGFDGGFTFLINPNLMVDLSGGGNVTDPVSGWFVEAGVAWRHHLLTW